MSHEQVVKYRALSPAVQSMKDEERAQKINPEPSRLDLALSKGPERWCLRCQTFKPLKGGKTRAGMFTCVGCLT